MKRNDCIIDCVGPDCEGCENYKIKKMKPTKELAKSGQKDDHIIEEILERLTGKKSGYWPETIKSAMQEYAELYHKEKLREELIKFAEWYDGDIIPKELIVEKYLKE